MTTENGHFDPVDFSNNVVEKLGLMNQHLEILGHIVHEVKKNQEKSINREVKTIIPGNTYSFNFQVLSIYVDNSAGASPITIVSESHMSYTIPANTQQWIHPLGGNNFDVTGTTNCFAMFVDTFLPIK